jgi:hypothetical protein
MTTGNQSVSQSTSQWVTVQEASEITGKSENAIGILIRRRRLDRVKKVNGTGQGKWLIHRDSLIKFQSTSQSPEKATENDQSVRPVSQSVTDLLKSMIPLEHYEKKRDEWDQERDRLQAGLMMYRYKFEELERQTRLLPAPLEIIPTKLEELEQKDQALIKSQETVKALEEALQRERQRSWWDRLWKK